MKITLILLSILSVFFTLVESFTSPSFILRKLDVKCENNNNPVHHYTNLFAGSSASTTVETEAPTGFIDVELRGAAMKLHTRSQAPKEGQAKEEKREPYTTTLDDYLRFLVDSQHAYIAFEEVISLKEMQPEMEPFINTGLERTKPLETDINFIVEEYGIARPPVGEFGKEYSKEIWKVASKGKAGIPSLLCHYYNHYFAHTAGGRMIGKQMSNLLLNKKTLEFYKYEGNLNEIKAKVKNSIEEMAASWSREEKDECVETTAAAFQGGGMLNAYLAGQGTRES